MEAATVVVEVSQGQATSTMTTMKDTWPDRVKVIEVGVLEAEVTMSEGWDFLKGIIHTLRLENKTYTHLSIEMSQGHRKSQLRRKLEFRGDENVCLPRQ